MPRFVVVIGAEIWYNIRPMRWKGFILFLGFVVSSGAGAAGRAEVSIRLAGEKYSVSIPKYADMSGVTWSGTGTVFYVVRDGGSVVSNGCYVHTMAVRLDEKGDCVKKPKMGAGILLDGAQDAEGIARDPLCGTIWVSDEADASIREYEVGSGKRTGRVVEVPRMMREEIGRASCRERV